MPGAIGGYRYPLSSEPVRDGAQAIQNLASDVAWHLPGNAAWVAIRTVPTFDANGLSYIAWSSIGMVWTARPAAWAIAEPNAAGAPASVVLQVFNPHTDSSTLVLMANYNSDGRAFSGALNVAIFAAGSK